MRLVTCKSCGWVHMAYTRAQAKAEAAKFNEYYDALPREKQLAYYGGQGSSITRYEKCWCGGTEFRPSEEGDCPAGCTIGPVIAE